MITDQKLVIAILVTTFVISPMVECKSQGGCTSKFLLPDRPFMVIWNKPSEKCEAHGIDLNLTAWDIVDNPHDDFQGENMIIFYHLGHWPSLDRHTGDVTANGGVPQRGNLTYHLQKAKADIEAGTKADFDGVGVFDMEQWRPNYNHNFDSLHWYQKVSQDIVKAHHPDWNSSAVQQEAAKEFDAGSKLFMESTLNLSNKLRPGGHFGYYGFPRNWGGDQNDQLDYLWRNSKGLFPRIYIEGFPPYPSTEKYVQGEVNETLRVWAKFASPDTLILPYSVVQRNSTSFFSKEYLSLAIGLPAKMGAAGVVLWGSSSAFYRHDECQLLQTYVSTVLGPYVKNLTQFFSDCSAFYCSAHGRCVEKQFEAYVQQQRAQANQKQCLVREELLPKTRSSKVGGDSDGYVHRMDIDDPPHPYQDYVCRCLAGWTGDHCEKKI